MYAWVSHLYGSEPACAAPVAGGWLVPAAHAVASAADRGLLLGDGLFEAIRVCGGRLPLLARHMRRLVRGCRLLGLGPVPGLRAAVAAVVRASGIQDGVVRVTVTRGPGPRGYDPAGSGPAFCLVQAHPVQGSRGIAGAGWRAIVSSVRIAPHPVLSRVKHTSALPRVVARQEARAAGADEALVLTPAGTLAEGAGTNLFWVRDGVIYTPALTTGALAGVARAWLLAWALHCGLRVEQGEWAPETLARADEAFLTNAVHGPVPLAEVLGCARWEAPGPVALRAMRAWRELCSGPARPAPLRRRGGARPPGWSRR